MRSSTGKRSLLAAMVFLFFSFSTAYATVMVFMDIEALASQSDVIVHARIGESRTYVDPSDEQVVTDTQLHVIRTVKGEHQRELTVQQWGGEYQGSIYRVPGDARLREGEEVVVFMHTGGRDGLYLTAMAQSVYRVIRDDKTVRVLRELSPLSFLSQTQGPADIEHRPDEEVELEVFFSTLEALVGGQP